MLGKRLDLQDRSHCTRITFEAGCDNRHRDGLFLSHGLALACYRDGYALAELFADQLLETHAAFGPPFGVARPALTEARPLGRFAIAHGLDYFAAIRLRITCVVSGHDAHRMAVI